MADNINSFFEKHTNVTIDRDFVLKVLTFLDSFSRRNDDHINFFGGNLVGVYTAKWIPLDGVRWIEDILDIQVVEQLKLDLRTLKDYDPTHKVASDVVNLSMVWTAHKALSSTLPEDLKQKLAFATIKLMQYKFLTSQHNRHFPYGAPEDLALAVHESLTKKSGLKRLGSWSALIDYRTNIIIDPDKKDGHYYTLIDFNTDLSVLHMVASIQGDIRSIMKNLHRTFDDLNKRDQRIRSVGNFNTIEGEEYLKDVRSRHDVARERLLDVIPNQSLFIKEGIVEAVVEIAKTVSPRQLSSTLKFFSENFEQKKYNKKYKQIIEDLLTYLFTMMRKEKLTQKDVPTIVDKFKGIVRSSRVTDTTILYLRELTGELVEDSLRTNSPGTISSTRIGVLLYLVILVLVDL